jgi:hypothetical protein
MYVYHFAPDNGELLGDPTIAEESPANPDPIIPSFSTPTQPLPLQPNKINVYRDVEDKVPLNWKDGAWKLVDDYRGTSYWLNGTQHTIDAIEVLVPTGASPNAPTPPDPTEAQLAEMAGRAVTTALNILAKAWQYSSYQSARTYKGDINPKFNAEGTALANYGSACYAILDQIAAGAIERPADESALLALLPDPPTRPTPPWS